MPTLLYTRGPPHALRITVQQTTDQSTTPRASPAEVDLEKKSEGLCAVVALGGIDKYLRERAKYLDIGLLVSPCGCWCLCCRRIPLSAILSSVVLWPP